MFSITITISKSCSIKLCVETHAHIETNAHKHTTNLFNETYTETSVSRRHMAYNDDAKKEEKEALNGILLESQAVTYAYSNKPENKWVFLERVSSSDRTA